MKRPLIHAPYKGVHPYFEILRFQDEKPPKDFHFFILTRTRYITGSKINLFFIGLLDSELFKGAAHTLMRQPLFFHYVGNIVLNLQRRYDGITRKSTAESLIAEGDFLVVISF